MVCIEIPTLVAELATILIPLRNKRPKSCDFGYEILLWGICKKFIEISN